MPRSAQPASKPSRRDAAATRQRLIDATIEVIRHDGVEALSTVSVTRQAGAAQSAFYAHFKNLDECKAAAAEQVAGRIRRFVAEHRRATTPAQGTSSELSAVLAHHDAVLSLFDTEREFAVLLLRLRYDSSPLGLVMRQLLEQMRVDLAADLRNRFEPLLPPGQHPERFAIYAELLQGMFLAAGEALLQNRLTDRKQLAHELTVTAWGMAQAVLASPH